VSIVCSMIRVPEIHGISMEDGRERRYCTYGLIWNNCDAVD
jgi:hypothetical protein